MQARLLLSQLTFSLLKNPTIRYSSGEEERCSSLVLAVVAIVEDGGDWTKR